MSRNKKFKESNIVQRENRIEKIKIGITDLVQNGIGQFGQSAIALRLSEAGISGGYHFADAVHTLF